MTIMEFLLARIAETEELAELADKGRWLPEDKGITFEFYGDDFHDGEAQARLNADTKANMRHIARHSPARALAECQAKRAIIRIADNRYPNQVGWYEKKGILEALAAVYKDHPDYEQEWDRS